MEASRSCVSADIYGRAPGGGRRTRNCSCVAAAETRACSGDSRAPDGLTTALVTSSRCGERGFTAGPAFLEPVVAVTLPLRACLWPHLRLTAHFFKLPPRMSRLMIGRVPRVVSLPGAPAGNGTLEGDGGLAGHTGAPTEGHGPRSLSSGSAGRVAGVSSRHQGGSGCRLFLFSPVYCVP